VRLDDEDRPPGQRNVKRWSSGEMALRRTAAGMLEAERQFRRIIGCGDLAPVVVAAERDHEHRRHASAARTPTTQTTTLVNA
jgi:putative transposase